MKKTCRPLSLACASSSARAGRPSRPARPASWYQASSEAGTLTCATVRTSALSTPMPNAFVATTTSTSPSMNRRCTVGAPLAGEARVVDGDLDPERRAEVGGDLLAVRAGAAVDDRRARRRVGERGRRGARRRRACARHGTTANVRFGRSNPVATRTGSRRPRRVSMSAATCGVAVAVDATTACAPSQRAASARRK